MLLLHSRGQAQSAPAAWVIGGEGGIPWSEPVLRWIALDDSTRPGALQLQEVFPEDNVLRERVQVVALLPRNIFNYRWSFNRGIFGMGIDTLMVDWHPRIWQGGAAEARGIRGLVDGDELTVAFTHTPPAGRLSANTWLTLDLGIPVAIDSVVFFPPQSGFTGDGTQLRDMYPEAYEVSRTNRIVDWLIFEDEAAATGNPGYNPLDEIIASTSFNTRSIVGLSMPPKFTRFIRLKFGGVRTTGVLSEIKAFARGFPAEGRYLSQPHLFDTPVSFGNVTWKFTKYRQAPSGEIFEDPTAPVELAIRTRAGNDPDPQLYFIYDELGRRIAVDRQTYFRAEPPKGAFEDGLPDFRAGVTDDVTDWNVWSIIYQNSGDKIRSSDGRRYFQFRIEMTTEDPFAFGVLDSLAFEISPLLADSILAEISLQGQPAPLRNIVEVPLGVDTVFVYDLRTVFLDDRKNGFDSIELEVPAGSQFLDLEIDGVPALEGREFSLTPAGDDYLRLDFPQRFMQNTSFRLRFRSAIFQTSVFFGGRLFDRDPAAAILPQSIEPGDARPEVTTNSIQVVAAQTRLDVLSDLRLASPAITPNGDGINDEVVIDFAVFGVENALIHVRVYDLRGRLIKTVQSTRGAAGHYRPVWNGHDETAALVPPGLYLIRVEVEVDRGTFAAIRPVAVVY